VRAHKHAGGNGAGLVVLVGEGPGWQPAIERLLVKEGYVVDRVARLDQALSLLDRVALRALVFASGPVAATDFLVLRRIREASPHTAVVVVTLAATDPDLKLAFESGATAFLSWPASNTALRHAIDPGARRPTPVSHS
jgi:DNA-binding response OmpR family regulator